MPNVPDVHTAAAVSLPHAVHLPSLSHGIQGGRFAAALEACRRVAWDVAGEGWTASAIHEPGCGTSYVFRFACPMASLRFSARAAMATSRCIARLDWRDPD